MRGKTLWHAMYVQKEVNETAIGDCDLEIGLYSPSQD